MSLTSEIANNTSPIGRFFRETFPNTRKEILSDCREALAAEPIFHLTDGAHRAAASQVGTAIDYRIRYHFAHTPVRKLEAAAGLLAVSTPDRLPVEVPPGWLQTVREFGLSPACADDFARTLEREIGQIAPHRRTPTDVEERRLARFCLVMAALEAVRRAFAWPPRWLGDTSPSRADELLGRVPDNWMDDAAALGAAFVEQYPHWHGSSDAVLNPRFAGSSDIGGADADFIADGCLWDIKTIRRNAASNDIFQIVGYALLDYEDEYAIERAGLLFPRQRTRVSWGIHELITRMSGDPGLELAALRERFRALCEQLREERES